MSVENIHLTFKHKGSDCRENFKKSLKPSLKQPSKYGQDKINCKAFDVPETSKNNGSRG